MMQLGADGVFVGSGIFKSENPEKFASAIVEATTHYEDYELIASLSKGLGNSNERYRNFNVITRTTHARAWMVIKGDI